MVVRWGRRVSNALFNVCTNSLYLQTFPVIFHVILPIYCTSLTYRLHMCTKSILRSLLSQTMCQCNLANHNACVVILIRGQQYVLFSEFSFIHTSDYQLTYVVMHDDILLCTCTCENHCLRCCRLSEQPPLHCSLSS